MVQADIKQGEKIYTERCVLCHGQAGEGWDWKKIAKPPVPVPNLQEVIPERTDEYLYTVIKEGGSAVGLSAFMPALGFNLSDQEIRNLISYLRSLNQQKNQKEGAFFKMYKSGKLKRLVFAQLHDWNRFNQFSFILPSDYFYKRWFGKSF